MIYALLVTLLILALGVAGTRVRNNRRLAGELPERTARACRELGAESTFVELDGVRLHVVVAGDPEGPLAVLLHGFPECWYAWRHQIGGLVARGYRVVAPDQRGYGLSDKPSGVASYSFDVLVEDVARLVRAFGRDRATVMGHDWGGAVAWKVAIDRPELVERLVIMNSPHPIAFKRVLTTDLEQLLRVWYMVLFQLPLLPEALLSFSPRFTASFFFRKNAFQRDAFTDDDLDFLASNFAQRGALTTMVNWYRAAVWYPAARPDTVVIDAPTLLLWAEDDVALGVGFTEGLGKWVPRMKRVLVAKCGHFIQTEQPAAVNEAIAAFVPGAQ